MAVSTQHQPSIYGPLWIAADFISKHWCYVIDVMKHARQPSATLMCCKAKNVRDVDRLNKSKFLMFLTNIKLSTMPS
jgi:hypothetical protein